MRKNTSAAAVSTSKLVHSTPSSLIASAASLTTPMTCSRSLSSMSVPQNLMHSVMLRISGDVKAPTANPDSLRMDSIMALTEPFPSVPATWTNLMPS